MLPFFEQLSVLFGVSTFLHLTCIIYIVTTETRTNSRCQVSSGNLLLVQNYIASILYMALLLVILKHPFKQQYSYLVLSLLVHVKVNQMLGLTAQKSIAVFYPLKLKLLVTRQNTKRFIWLTHSALVVVYLVGCLLASWRKASSVDFEIFMTAITAVIVIQLSVTLLASLIILVRFLIIKLHQEGVNIQQRKQKRRMVLLNSAMTLSIFISYVPVMFMGLGLELVPLFAMFYLYCVDQILGPLMFIGLAVDHSTWWKNLRCCFVSRNNRNNSNISISSIKNTNTTTTAQPPTPPLSFIVPGKVEVEKIVNE